MVARWRDTAGLTQAELADRVGVTPSYISQIENGKKIPDKLSFLGAVADALHITVNDLTGQPYPPRHADGDAASFDAQGLRVRGGRTRHYLSHPRGRGAPPA